MRIYQEENKGSNLIKGNFLYTSSGFAHSKPNHKYCICTKKKYAYQKSLYNLVS
jgi:hypothetical protein